MRKRVTHSVYLLVLLFMLAACGGGDGLSREDTSNDDDTDSGSTSPNIVTLTISEPDGTEGNVLSESTPLLVTALVTDAEQNPIDDELVTFSFSTENIATFDNSTGTALTNNAGIATIGIIVGEASGSGLVIGTISSGETDNVGFNSEGAIASIDTPSSLLLFADATQLASSGVSTLELSAIVRNEQNVLLENIAVSFSADQQASLAIIQGTTDTTGIATASLSTISSPENRIITTTASISGFPELTQELEIAVVGTSISISGPNSIVISDPSEYTILLEDSSDAGIVGESVVLTVVDASNTDLTDTLINQNQVITNANGQLTFDFVPLISGSYTFTATAIGTSSSFSVNVQEDDFGFVNAPDITNINEDFVLNQNHTVTLQWLRENQPLVGGTVTLSSSRGTISDTELVTDSDGSVTFTIQSDNAGLASLSATGNDGENNSVTATTEVSFIAVTPSTVIVDATPDSIGPNGETSTISAIVRDEDGNRVGNQVVNFSVSDVANGSLSPAQATTDRTGVASTVYTSNSSSSNEAVFVTASVGGVEGQATLTVGDSPLDISLGTGNIIESPDLSTYSKEFSVFVTDADGNPVSGTEISMSVTPLREADGATFFKGFWVFDDEGGFYIPVVNDSCVNEDENFNGSLDDGEDTNGDGQLTPGNVAVVTPASIITDENGQALVNVVYQRQFGAWSRVRLTARGQSNGTESSQSMLFTLSVAAEDIVTEESPPPNSPFGITVGCDNIN
ncbi:Ig-like domain-containing protein [Alteromonas sp. 5E99-2]|uniref:Ig-like domain-containing protein n=1 Tax=Alteromonas sp. 5E99-2 TaxID=2817683 RepID=UPI001A99D8D3|nr:Ig-like domain-containing protein [Alteromonas sp. 5E99-2]MBO1254947.1 Ig-like domain-containing protein [Alteromonas sp. 5E99-2]